MIWYKEVYLPPPIFHVLVYKVYAEGIINHIRNFESQWKKVRSNWFIHLWKGFPDFWDFPRDDENTMNYHELAHDLAECNFLWNTNRLFIVFFLLTGKQWSPIQRKTKENQRNREKSHGNLLLLSMNWTFTMFIDSVPVFSLYHIAMLDDYQIIYVECI